MESQAKDWGRGFAPLGGFGAKAMVALPARLGAFHASLCGVELEERSACEDPQAHVKAQ